MNVKFSELTPGAVLDDSDAATLAVLKDVRTNTKMLLPGMYRKIRTVKSVQKNRTYTYLTFESYAIVRRPHDYEVKTL